MARPIGRVLVKFRANSTVSGRQVDPAVAMADGGQSVIVWWTLEQAINGIYGQIYDEIGSPVGSEFLISDPETGNFPRAAMDADGDFVVTWTQTNLSGEDAVYARLYDPLGVA